MEQKIILVTGANKGIGLEIVRTLAQQNHDVILTARSDAKGKDALSKLKAEGLTAYFIQLDVSDGESIKHAVKKFKEEFDHLDVLINNAGIYDDKENSLNVSRKAVQQHFDTNFFGPLLISQAFVPLLKKSKDGRIINFGSQMGRFATIGSGSAAYRFSKTAINSLTAVMAADLSGTSIKVNSLHPGWVKTDMGGSGASSSIKAGADTAVWLATADNIPTGKFFENRKETPF